MSQTIIHKSITSRVLKAFFTVYNSLGFGFLEKVYENAMMLELSKLGLKVRRQERISVYYEEVCIGEYFADILVEEKVILELKAEGQIHPMHEAQLLNYLKATKVEVGLLLNFGSEPSFKRKIFFNNDK